jgi:uncharacterized membrane protein
MDQAFSVEAWTSPIGIGIFLVCLGFFILLLSKADQKSPRKKKK